MAAYMKTEMPFYGIQKPDRLPIYREIKSRFVFNTRAQYSAAILGLWEQPHREEKYAAIHLARMHRKYITPASLPLYRRLIIEGAWWDLVDDVAIRLVGFVLLHHRPHTSKRVERWIDDSNMWIRRTALICHIGHKGETDERQLFDHCLRRADEREFFIRKAIGWTLREYAKTAPTKVRRFLQKHESRLSTLSFREAAKHLNLARRTRV